MLKKITYILFLLVVISILFVSSNAKIIFAGIAIFLIGMLFMEDGFKAFTGGLLENILERSTNSTFKSISTGFIVTSIVQSSSLVSIVIISLLSAELISLSGAVGVIFGSNIGTTVTAWIVSAFGVKIHIAHYAMPMLILGVIFKFTQIRTYEGIGNILIGLGFVFLGISYMKEGFETLQEGINLMNYAMEGYLGVFIYVLIGILATVIMQSSSATMTVVIVALSTNQILYFNALELAIGANVGTTITAILGSLTSNENGKRLAVAHFIFNIVTAFIAIVFLYQLADLVGYLTSKLGISKDEYVLHLALFHTIFNVIGVIVMLPFTSRLVEFLKNLFVNTPHDISRARYLDTATVAVSDIALVALKKEVIHLYDNTTEVLSHALLLHRHTYIGMGDKIDKIVDASVKVIDIDMDSSYEKKVKSLYGDIIHYATIAEESMSVEDKHRVYDLKIASLEIVETIKDVTLLQKNMNHFIKSKNSKIKQEYNHLREEIAKTLDGIHSIKHYDKEQDDFDVLAKMELLKVNLDNLDVMKTGRVDQLIRNGEIETKMATSLINDSAYAYNISKKLIHIATILWVENSELRNLGDAS